MHPVIAALFANPSLGHCDLYIANPSLGHCDLYIDDSSFDMEDNSVATVVHKSLEVWRHVKQAFKEQNLPISK